VFTNSLNGKQMSSQAYQGGGRGLSQETLTALSDIVLKGLKPDLVIYLDIRPEVGLARAKGRGKLDRIEREALAFFERTRERYISIAKANDHCIVIDAEQSIECVHQDIVTVLNHFYLNVTA
jgi:dTMP kinase